MMNEVAPSTDIGIDPRITLLRKKTAELSGHGNRFAFAATDTPISVDADLRSAYSPKHADDVVALGMGYVQAVLSMLHGLVTSWTYDSQGYAGTLTMLSASNDNKMYHFSWRRDRATIRMGGFTHAGQPTFHAAVICLLHLMSLYRCGEREHGQEVIERWYALVKAMDEAYPRSDQGSGWNRSAIEDACISPSIRPLIIRVCDALRAALSSHPPSMQRISVGVVAPSVLPSGAGTAVSIAPSELLDPACAPSVDVATSTTIPTPLPPSLPPLSISRLRLLLTCGNAYRLVYLDREVRRPGASLWYGSLMHLFVSSLYAGKAVDEALAHAWEAFCPGATSLLEQWHHLDAECAEVGSARSKAALAWRSAHPDYARLQDEIAAYQQRMHHVRWGESSLAGLYRKSMRLLDVSLDALLLPYPLFVEGRRVSDEVNETLPLTLSPGAHEEYEGFDDERERRARYLMGFLKDGEIPIVGIPDIIAEVRNESHGGEAGRVIGYRFGDVKATDRFSTPRQLRVDVQLLLYYHMALQNALIDPDVPVEIGHIYIPSNGKPRQVWTDTAMYSRMMPIIEAHFAAALEQIKSGRFLPMLGIHGPYRSPCETCDVAHVCKLMQ